MGALFRNMQRFFFSMKKIFIISFLLTHYCGIAQDRNSIWIFGDSAGINFGNPNNPVPLNSAMRGRGSCASVADSIGQLQFYAHTIANLNDTSTHVYNWQNQLMNNGDQIVGEAWYNELVIVPMPDSSDFYYLFSIGVASGPVAFRGLFYSIIDMSANGGLGEVVSKNNILSNLKAMDGIGAIKHGNGRDLWSIFKPDGYDNPQNNDQ